MNNISIVVPVRNEEANVKLLVEKIDKVLKKKQISYEIIFIDDNSSDNTVSILQDLKNKYEISVHLKKGKVGKAFSLIEGFSYAKYEIIGMIDADLQYSPEYFPRMISKIQAGSDIVIANRRKYDAGWTRKIMSKIFHKLFINTLHGIQEDAQSGLKVFKKSVINHLSLNPSSWTFDLEFLVKAKNAGYTINSIDIIFEKRHTGESKIAIIPSALEIAYNAVCLKFMTTSHIPFSEEMKKEKGIGFHSKGKEFIHHTDLNLKDSAFISLVRHQHGVMVGFIMLLLLGIIINWYATLVLIISTLSIIYFADLLFNLFLIYRSFFKEPELKVSKREIALFENGILGWPRYSILCPLYKEWEVLPQFIQAMSNLDYPKDKLQVMLLLEQDDTESIERIKKMSLPYYFDVVVVPDSQPKTKPKALNYGLSQVTGEYMVIYDAEDIPDTAQLKKSVIAFKKAKKNIICIQAKLNFYNPTQNILTRLFAIEYSLWFNLVLTGLQSIQAPIPLGGTSNHFRTQDIVNLNKWDPFNVTEDADLGMRIMKRGFRTAIINSYTMEEANSNALNWLKQRSRWIKGYIQTYFVHMRHPQAFFNGWKIHHFLTFQLVIGAKILSMLVNPFMWIMTITYFAFRPFVGDFINSLFLTPIFYMAIFSMVIGNFLYMYYYMLGAAKRDQWGLIPFALLTPLYWLGMSIAASFALWEFIVKPHYWHKTQHGLHLTEEDTTVDLQPSVRIAVSQ